MTGDEIFPPEVVDYEEPKAKKILVAAALVLALTAFLISLMLSHFAPMGLLVAASTLAFVVVLLSMYALWKEPSGGAPSDKSDLPENYPKHP